MRILRMMLVLFAPVFVLGCTQAPQVDLDAERASLTAAAEAYHTAAGNLDVESLMALYTDNTWFLPTGEDEVSGLDDIRDWLMGMLDLTNFEAIFESPTVHVSTTGACGYSLATATMSFVGPDGEHVSQTVRDLHVWEKSADGSWKIVVDMSNEPAGNVSEDV